MADAEHIEQQDAEQPWQKLTGEKHVWYSRFLTFRDMGPARSVNGAYIIEHQNVATHGKRLNVSPTWYEKSKEFNWHERAQAWDEYRRKEVFTQGYARDLTRIQKLDGLQSAYQAALKSIGDMLSQLPAAPASPPPAA